MTVTHKKPFQLYLREEQMEALRRLAKKRGVSMAELVRQSVDDFLAETPLEDEPLWGLVGIGASGTRDLSEQHDAYLEKEELQDNQEKGMRQAFAFDKHFLVAGFELLTV